MKANLGNFTWGSPSHLLGPGAKIFYVPRRERKALKWSLKCLWLAYRKEAPRDSGYHWTEFNQTVRSLGISSTKEVGWSRLCLLYTSPPSASLWGPLLACREVHKTAFLLRQKARGQTTHEPRGQGNSSPKSPPHSSSKTWEESCFKPWAHLLLLPNDTGLRLDLPQKWGAHLPSKLIGPLWTPGVFPHLLSVRVHVSQRVATAVEIPRTHGLRPHDPPLGIYPTGTYYSYVCSRIHGIHICYGLCDMTTVWKQMFINRRPDE